MKEVGRKGCQKVEGGLAEERKRGKRKAAERRTKMKS